MWLIKADGIKQLVHTAGSLESLMLVPVLESSKHKDKSRPFSSACGMIRSKIQQLIPYIRDQIISRQKIGECTHGQAGYILLDNNEDYCNT